jgi:hypothetical protein
MPAELMRATCAACNSGWIDARYDYDAVGQTWPHAQRTRPNTLWR